MAIRPRASVLGSPMTLKYMAPTICDDVSHGSWCQSRVAGKGRHPFSISCPLPTTPDSFHQHLRHVPHASHARHVASRPTPSPSFGPSHHDPRVRPFSPPPAHQCPV